MDVKHFLILFLLYCKNILGDDGKIFHGIPVRKQEEFPYAVQLIFQKTLICGCSSLNPGTILTAAHCVIDTETDLSIIAGSLISGKGGQKIEVKSVHVHPLHNQVTYDYDCAIVRLHNDINYNSKIKPVKLAMKRPRIGTAVEIAGWGLVEKKPTNKYSVLLRYTVIKICPLSKCEEIYSVTNRMICAGYQKSTVNAAEGDSGGPLILYRTNTQVGLTSWGNLVDGLPFSPLAYTNLAHPKIKRFINRMIKSNDFYH